MQNCNLSLPQPCTNSGCQVAMATKFCIWVANIFGASVWNLLHVTPQIYKK
jgi:hypothetical protein